jgi:hypothetical protein
MTQWPGYAGYDPMAKLWWLRPCGLALVPMTLWAGCNAYDPVAWLRPFDPLAGL